MRLARVKKKQNKFLLRNRFKFICRLSKVIILLMYLLEKIDKD